MPDNFVATGEGLLLVANGIDSILREDGYISNLEPAGLAPPDTAVSAVGSGIGTLEGTYFAYVTFLRNDGFESAMSPVSADIILNLNAQIDYSSIPVSDDTRVTGRRIYRNTDGQSRTVYLDVEIADNVSTTATSTTNDSLLQENLAFPLFDNLNNLLTLDASVPPDTKPFIAWHLGRTYYHGHTDYSEGSCEVTVGSNQIQGRGTQWKANWPGRLIYINGADKTYEIDSVDVANQIITLTENFTGVTNLFAGYTVRPTPGECATLYYSLPNEPEKVPPTNGIAVPDEDDVDTGLMPLYGYLYLLKRKSIYRLTAQNDPGRDGFLFLSNKRGCVNQRCAVVVGDVAFILDERGAYMFSGGQESQDISGQIQDIFKTDSTTPINWNAARYFHAAHSPGESTIRWHVCFRGDYVPRHALCYCYALQRWWIEFYPRPVGASVLGQAGRQASSWGRSSEQVFLGLDAGSIMAFMGGAPDVAVKNAATSSKVLSAGLTSVTMNEVLTSDMVGAPIVHRANAHAALQTRRITAVDGNEATVHPPWAIVPVADDEVMVGGFAWQYRTSQFRFVGGEANTERSFEVFFSRNKGSKMDVSFRYDDDEEQVLSACNIDASANFGVQTRKDRSSSRIDMSKREGFALLKFDGLREGTTDGHRTIQVTLTGVGGNKQDAIAQLVAKGVVA